jgi:hypothetical protein
MKVENKHNLMIWTIIILVIINVSTIITIAYHQLQSNESAVSATADPKQPEVNADKFSGRFFRTQLNFSNEQMEKFRQINPLFRPKVREITIELAQKRQLMLREMSSANCDTIRLNAFADSIGKLHSNLKKLTYRYYLEIKEICNSEQQKNLELLFSDVFNSDATLNTPGPGGQHGRQYGRQSKN